MKYVITGVKTLLLIYLIIFCVSNTAPVTVALFPEIAMIPQIALRNIPLFVTVVAALLAGGLLAILAHTAERMRASKEIKHLRRKVASSEAEQAKMSPMPFLSDDEEKAE